jgi:hypothetical protein
MLCPEQMVRRAARAADRGVREIMTFQHIGDNYVRLWTPMFHAAMEELRDEREERRKRAKKAALARKRRKAKKR